jgi:hypothetical protein
LAARGGADLTLAESNYTAALVLAESHGMRPLVAHCHAALAKVYERTGELERRPAHLTAASLMYRDMEMVFWVETAEAGASYS